MNSAKNVSQMRNLNNASLECAEKNNFYFKMLVSHVIRKTVGLTLIDNISIVRLSEAMAISKRTLLNE